MLWQWCRYPEHVLNALCKLLADAAHFSTAVHPPVLNVPPDGETSSESQPAPVFFRQAAV